MNKTALGVVFGGKSSEYAVSLHSAASLLRQIRTERYAITMIAISKEGEWFLYEGSIDALEHDRWQQEKCTPCALTHDGLLILHEGSYEIRHLDCIFPVLHGKNGEDGTIQGLIEMAGIPVVGCGALSSALCMDKDRAHKLVGLAGVDVPAAIVLQAMPDEEELSTRVAQLGYPVFENRYVRARPSA